MLVSTLAELSAAFIAAKPGDTILLAPGLYAPDQTNGKSSAFGGGARFTKPVVFASQDPAHPAIIQGVELNGGAFWTFKDVILTPSPRTQSPFWCNDCEDITIIGGEIHGAEDDREGMRIRGSKRVTLLGVDIHGLGVGVQSIDSTDVRVSECQFFDLKGDGMKITGTSGLTLARNLFHTFSWVPGDHPDAVQLFTVNQKESMAGIEIVDNLIVRGGGMPVQGLFLGNEWGLPHLNVRIASNTIMGMLFRGLTLGTSKSSLVEKNTVIQFADQPSWVQIEGAVDAVVRDNRSPSVDTSVSPTVKATGTITDGTTVSVEDGMKLGAKAIADWKAKYRAAAAPPVVVDPPPVVTDPPPVVDPPIDPPPVEQPDPVPAPEASLLRLEAVTDRLEALAATEAETANLKAVAAARLELLDKAMALATTGTKVTNAPNAKKIFSQILALKG